MRSYKYILSILALLMSLSMRGQYNPTNPAEPGVYYTLTLEASPSAGGSFNLGTTTSYSEGTTVNLRAYTNSYFTFTAWEQDGEVISTSASFTYTMPAKNVKLIAHYKYSPSNPEEPTQPDIPIYSTLYLSASPSAGGYFNINSGNKYEVGSAVSLRAYNNSNFSFKNWTENGEVVSTSSSFQYVMKEGNPILVANFTYNPGNPAEPSEAQLSRKLYLKSNPSGGGYFNVNSGNEYQEGSTVYLQAYSNQWYSFINWTNEDGEVVSTSSSFNYVMPEKDITLTANYSYSYNPSTPDEPNKPSSEQVNIYGMTENGVRGQTIIYPIYLENTSEVKGMVVDVQFPKGFIAETGRIALSGRASGHEMEVKELGNNNFRFSLLGDEAFTGDNGKMFEVPVSIPDTATMGHNYPVILTHGVMHGTDGSQTAISVRNGYIYVEKVSEDGLYAKFSYDKLQGRVKFTNLSSGNAQSYVWDFGDGTTSTEKNPLHIYAKSGYYTVKLTAKGEVDTDLAEQTVLINDESSWRIDGTFYLSEEEKGVRYFTSAESLFKFIGGTPLSGNVKIAVMADGEYNYPLTAANTTLLRNIQSSLANGSYTMSFTKNGVGRNPILLFGEQGGSFDKSFVDFFIELGKNLACEGVDLKLWGVSFNPAQIEKLNNQTIHSGAKTTEVDFSSISADLKFIWTLSSAPANVTGYQTTGERTIPAMTIVNEGEGNCDLIYNIIGTRYGTTFCEFTNTITVTPALVGLFNSLSPADGYVSESTTVTLTWNNITNAVYDVYLWNAANQRPNTPVAEGTTELRYTSRNFCQNGNTYKWQIVARNESQSVASDTMSFAIRSLPNLHVYALDCSTPTAGDKFTVQWTVKNDGVGSTGDQQWNDYIWIVTDIYGGTQPSGNSDNKAQLLATVKNVKALESGESYQNSVDITLPERIYGNYYLLVATDMYSVTDIQWSAIGGSVINPYNPTQDGSGYKHLYANTSASYNKVYEQGETTTLSDNFFYKKIEIAVPNIADLQVPTITAQVLPNQEPTLAAAARARAAAIHGDNGYLFDEDNNLIYSWEECYVPSPITAAGLRGSNAWYSGKKIAVTVTIANKGGEDTKENFNTVLYMSTSPDREAAPLTAIASKTCKKNIKPGESTTLTYAFYLPYEWFGDLYFHAYADVNDAVYELANTQNNWGKSDKYDVLLCPGADFVPNNLSVPSSLSNSSTFNVSYSVKNQGSGIPYVTNWKDKIYLSKKNTGLDDTATLLHTVNYSAGFDPVTIAGAPGGGMVIIKPEEFHYSKDNYSKNVTVTPQNLTSGTYYIYVKVDADNVVYEHDGEDNNVLMYGPINYTFTQADLSAELTSISVDTLKTGAEVAFTWKLKNTGNADIQDARITDVFYATVNQTATGGTEIARVENSVWIAAGQDKTLRANITIPSNANLDGLRYVYLKTNANNAVAETSSSNNTSGVVKSWFTYTTEPQVKTVRGANLYISDLNVQGNMKPGDAVTLTYIARNNGDADITEREIEQEVYMSNDYNFNINNATKCEVTSQTGSVSGLKTTKAANISLTFTVPNLYGGRKYLHVFADRTNTLGAKNTNYNHAYTQVTINGNLPDLEVTAYSMKDTLYTSQPTPLTFTVSNTGEWDAGKTTTMVYLSSNDRYDSNDIRLASISTDALAKGASSEFSTSVSVDDKKAGNWYVLIQTDANNQLSEMNESNSVKAIPVTVVQSPLPDLTATALSTDSVLTSGLPMKIVSTVKNIGKNATRSNKWADTYYLSSSTVLNTKSAIQLGSKTHVGTLEIGSDYTSEVSFTIPSTVQGNYVLFVVTDAADAIAEEDENNNSKGIPVFINGSYDTPADLQIANVSAPGNIKAGDDVTISYKIENVGEYAAAANLHDVIYLSKDNRWDLNDVMVGVVSGNVTIEAGNSITRNATGRITNMPEGDYYVIVKTNSTRTVAEQNSDNNVGVMKSTSRLSFNTINLGSSSSVNTSGYYKLNIPSGYEGKTVGFYLEHPADATAGLYAAYEQVPSTAKYGFASSSLSGTQQEVLIPNVQAGDYYILAQDNAALVNSTGNQFRLSDSGQQSAVTSMMLTAKDIQFGATTLSISEGGNGGWVSTDVNGAMFDSIMDFRLKLAQTVIPAEAITYNGMTKSRVTFNLNKAEVGTYDVVSELPDGTVATLPQGFKVIPGASVNLGAKIDAPSVVRVGSYAPVSISYANGGNTDCELYDLILVIDNGYLATTIEGLEQHQSVLHLPIDTESDIRGYKTIPPGTQKTINIFMYQIANNSNLTIYLVK